MNKKSSETITDKTTIKSSKLEVTYLSKNKYEHATDKTNPYPENQSTPSLGLVSSIFS